MTQNININMNMDTYIKNMPSLPVSVRKVIEICNRNNVFVNPLELNRVISLDPVLTGKLLQLINSAYYGLNNHGTSLVKAITMLGINTVKNLALSSAILNILPKDREFKGLDMEGFWRHSLCVAVISKLIAQKKGIDPAYHQEYFTAGLLHDIGKIPLNAVLSGSYMNTVTIADQEHLSLFMAENDSLGTNHCAAGKLTSDTWKLDDLICDVITWHHDTGGYSGKNSDILYIVAAADYFSVLYEIGFAGNRKAIKPDANIWETTGLNDDFFEGQKEKVFQEIEKAKIFLKIS